VGNPPASVPMGQSVTITVNEANTGDDALTNVSVTGGPCPTWTPVGVFDGTLAPGASQSFTCTFTVNDTVNWFADGQGTDSLGNPVPTTGEHQEGTVKPAAVSIVKLTNGQDANDPDGTDVPRIQPGDPVTWTYQVTNTGQTSVPRADVSVTDNVLGVTP